MSENAPRAYMPDKALFKDSYVSSIEQYKEMYAESIEHNSDFWDKNARELLSWQHDYQMVSDCDFCQKQGRER